MKFKGAIQGRNGTLNYGSLIAEHIVQGRVQIHRRKSICSGLIETCIHVRANYWNHPHSHRILSAQAS